MYFGSIRFFKHLILATLAAIIIIPSLLCIHYKLEYNALLAQLKSKDTAQPQTDQTESDSKSAAKGGFNLVYASADGESTIAKDSSSLSYQSKYPNLYVENDFQYKDPEQKTVYLTFDDGPTTLTPKVLDVLKQYNVKATFFIVYKDSAEAKALYKRMVAEGHTIAVHSTTHIYKQIYQSVDAYLTDFAQTAQMLESVTGQKIELFRFPGGSINNYNRTVYMPLISEMLRRGYTYYDWNVGSGDTISRITSKQIYENVINGAASHQESIVLMHDQASHQATLEALPQMIKTLQNNGYNFSALDKTVKPVCFGYPD